MIEITDEMVWRALASRSGDDTPLYDILDDGADDAQQGIMATVRAALAAVAPLIAAQAREKALREIVGEAGRFILPYGVHRPTQFMLGQTTAAEQICGAILNRIGAPQQNTQSGATGVQSESQT